MIESKSRPMDDFKRQEKNFDLVNRDGPKHAEPINQTRIYVFGFISSSAVHTHIHTHTQINIQHIFIDTPLSYSLTSDQQEIVAYQQFP
jgi:hypothetical protein